MWKFLAGAYLRAKYAPDIEMESVQKLREAGERVIVAAHYASYLDPVLFGVFAPGSPTVVITPTLAKMKWFRDFAHLFRHETIDPADPFSLKQLTDLFQREPYVVVFPEPEPTTSGLLQKLSDAAVAAMAASGAWIVPARACNTQFTPYSRMGTRLACRKPPRIRLASFAPQRLDGDGEKSKRDLVYLKLEQVLCDAMTQGIWDRKPLFDTLLEQRKIWGGKHVMSIEPDGQKTDWNSFLTQVLLLQEIVEGLVPRDARIGIMLPNTTMTLAAIIAVQHADREPAMINYSMGSRSLISACGTADVKKIVTSRRFVDEGKFQPLVDALTGGDLEILFLEDLLKDVAPMHIARIAISALLAKPTPDAARYAERTALVLFTSGSEGAPKPVALSHLNIQANTAQVRSTLDFYRTDVMLNIMPMFHSFGLCTGTFMPLSTGMPIAFYPTPLHYKKIPQYAYETKATVILGTNAFLAGYAKNGEPFDFFEMRYVICGGDKLREATAKLWVEKFGIRVLEGYGVTEASPVVGVNRLGRCKQGSIGRALPCIETRLAPVEGVAEGGRLVVRGPNVMKGYIKTDGSILPPEDGWYDTGDIVEIDAEGYITIQGRAKRFAKIGGEMVSLAHIEEAVQEVWPDHVHAAVSIPDENRGEIIVLLTERPSPDREELRSGLTKRGLPELALPKKIVHTEAIPKIGVGKIDYQSAAKVASGE